MRAGVRARHRSGARWRATAMGAQVKVFLSSDERRELLKLGYKPDEVDTMRVEIATKLIAARTKRPFGAREMPDSWRKVRVQARA